MTAVLDRDAAVAAWRRAESRIYPSVMVNAGLYQEYVTVVQAVSQELSAVTDEQSLVTAWQEQHDLVREVVARSSLQMTPLMDLEAVRDAAFCHRHRELTRQLGRELARERLEQAKRSGAEWVVLFDDVTPVGSHVLEMHVASGRALHAASELPLDASRPRFTLEVVQLDPRDGAWLLDQPPLMPTATYDNREEWEARIAAARLLFRRS
ncbi:hypothetical protein [Conexibacter sp. CPCC 206217]|uniref:hypothetical protein n=1 Tax=Conexibacter sp. CPCC 206217 TaxID=3064574 RepID=UPI00272898F1|nr:hypothetical protein [Conexibacter sp. CPCC 206217]MDO8212347.1 hypothetical protein [Conexibacter sp. CPCC 206217]